ncbi:MAG: SDR family NAD(P)-dependent oxidoreductase [Candidatus Latescibacteria bacterium]|jgi:3-oxoacyl-[acyl-carrier protein] reductase|nr:SDR family NAD(P)-dependent oxidoreductase [Candidatus Latescibacterota bacterium]
MSEASDIGCRFMESVVLVTGAAGGIGSAICARFEALGARVFPTDRVVMDAPRFIQGDLSDSAFPREWVARVSKEAGRIDVLVNNAGICPRTPLDEITLEEWNQVLTVNLTSAFLLSQTCIEAMIRQGSGSIVNVGSMAGRMGGVAVGAHYSATKAALICLTKTLARHGAPRGVRVNAVAPGVIDTEITAAAAPEMRETLRASIPLGRFGSPEEVAETILFLASAAASYVTGVTLDVNGGLLMD